MYIDHLTDKELETIFKDAMGCVEEDKETINEYYNNCRIVHGYDGTWINFVFKTKGGEEQMCQITDFELLMPHAGFIGQHDALKTYRRFMFGKFGQSYYNNMRDVYKYQIESKREQQLSLLAKDLDDMTR